MSSLTAPEAAFLSQDGNFMMENNLTMVFGMAFWGTHKVLLSRQCPNDCLGILVVLTIVTVYISMSAASN
jgi:hypothetical protein